MMNVDDDARLPLRSVFPISFNCLYSHVAGPEDDANDDGIGIGSIEGLRSDEICVGKGCDEQIGSEDMSNVGSDPSSSTLRRQRRQPKHKRQQQQRRSALAPTSCLVAGRPLPSGLDPTEPGARVVDSRRRSHIHGAPSPNPNINGDTTTRCVPKICNQDNQHSHNKRAAINDNDGDNNDDDEQHTSSSPSVLHAATGPLGRPRSTPVRERPGVSQPHHQDAVMGSSCAP